MLFHRPTPVLPLYASYRYFCGEQNEGCDTGQRNKSRYQRQ